MKISSSAIALAAASGALLSAAMPANAIGLSAPVPRPDIELTEAPIVAPVAVAELARPGEVMPSEAGREEITGNFLDADPFFRRPGDRIFAQQDSNGNFANFANLGFGRLGENVAVEQINAPETKINVN